MEGNYNILIEDMRGGTTPADLRTAAYLIIYFDPEGQGDEGDVKIHGALPPAALLRLLEPLMKDALKDALASKLPFGLGKKGD